jgi:diguanylate cyclase (GGDEF)-like protein
LNLDGFKEVNDMYGHSAGDDVLRAVAQALSQTSRRSDLAARLEGDHFMLVMTDADQRDATEAAKQICETIKFARARIAPDIAATTSIGWVFWRQGATVDELIESAEDSLQQASEPAPVLDSGEGAA